MTKKSNNKRNTKQQRRNNTQRVPRGVFGPVTAVSTAPVAIGNSLRGARSTVVVNSNGVRVMGREFMFPAQATAESITTWCAVGGAPITPAAFSDSVLRQYVQMFNLFRCKRLTAHYITSSPTSAAGDVMIYHNKNRNSVFLNQTSANLLPFVLSDDDTVLGPQWTNHSADLKVTSDWKSCDYGMSSVLDDFADGDVFLLSKTSTVDSPGYVLFDYEFEFREQSLQPRLLTLPISRAIWQNVSVGTTANYSANATIALQVAAGTSTHLLDGTTTSAMPAGNQVGDIYKVIMDITNSNVGGWTNGGGLSTIAYGGNHNETIALSDGFTCYAVCTVGGTGADVNFYANSESAFTGSNAFVYSANAGGTSSATIQCWFSYVGSVGTATNLLPNY